MDTRFPAASVTILVSLTYFHGDSQSTGICNYILQRLLGAASTFYSFMVQGRGCTSFWHLAISFHTVQRNVVVPIGLLAGTSGPLPCHNIPGFIPLQRQIFMLCTWWLCHVNTWFILSSRKTPMTRAGVVGSDVLLLGNLGLVIRHLRWKRDVLKLIYKNHIQQPVVFLAPMWLQPTSSTHL